MNKQLAKTKIVTSEFRCYVKGVYQQYTDFQEPKRCYYSVAMDIIPPEVGTGAHLFLQGRVVLILLDLDWKKMILLGLLSLKQVGRDLLSVEMLKL